MARKYVYEVKGSEDGTLGFFTNVDKASVKAVWYVSQDCNKVRKLKQNSPYHWEFESDNLRATIEKHLVS